MPFTLYDASIPMMVRMLRNLSAILEVAAAHAEAAHLAPATMIEAKLAPDMFNLARQVQSAADAAKTCAARLAGEPPPSFPDTETTFDELQARIAKTIAYVQGFSPEQINGAENRTITLPIRKQPVNFTGAAYLTTFSLPNFFFHVTTAYDILRQQGVAIGKMSYWAIYERPCHRLTSGARTALVRAPEPELHPWKPSPCCSSSMWTTPCSTTTASRPN